MLSQNRHAGGADLVGGVAVGGHPVAAHEAGLDPAVLHDNGGHVVADQRHVHPGPLELIAGEPGALEQGAGLVGEYPDVHPSLRRQQEGALGRAVSGGGKGPGITVCQDAVALLQQTQTVFGDGPAFGDVVLMDGYCPLVQSVQHLAPGIVDMLQGGAHHLPDGPAQIHRRGTGRVQLLAIVAEALQKRGTVLGPDGLGQHIHTVGGADADGRGPPHPQGPDGLHHLVNGLEADLLLLPRQQGLVDDVKGLRLPVVADVLGMGYRGDIWHGGSSFPNGGRPSGLPGQRLRVLPSSVSQFPRRRKGGRSAVPFSSSVVMA